MTPIKQQLDEVNGTAALITNLKSPSLRPSEKLMLYTAEQRIVTRCTYFEQFTTEEAYLSAAETYGGLTRERLVVCC